MAPQERVLLLDTRLEVTRHLSAEERTELGSVSLPVIAVDPGALDLATLLARHNAFGATVLEGMVMNALQIGEQTGIQLLGPGDVLLQSSEISPEWLTVSELRTTVPVRLALFGRELLGAVYRWPRLVQGLYVCLGDQLQRLTAQLVICQLSRVDERVLAMMWLLAESWGQVTPGGVRLPLTLTHETLGSLVGARRPTVTLALRNLTDEGALVHQDSGWLLLKRPPEPAREMPRILGPEVSQPVLGRWGAPPPPAPPPPPQLVPSMAYAELRETVRQLREQHQTDRQRTRDQLSRARSTRARATAARRQIAENAVRRRSPPSS